jgi:hypothetical protein
MGASGAMFGGMDPSMFKDFSDTAQQRFSGLGQLFGGLFGNYANPYNKAQDAYQNESSKVPQYLNPFFKAGTDSIPDYQNYLKGMSDPSQFINHLMSGYQESPYAKYQQNQSMRAARNMGSASGLGGSTPLTQFAEQQAQGIASGDQQNYLNNVMGANQQYGQGLSGMMNMGYGAGSQLADWQKSQADQMANFAYNKAQAKQNQGSDIWGGLSNILF